MLSVSKILVTLSFGSPANAIHYYLPLIADSGLDYCHSESSDENNSELRKQQHEKKRHDICRKCYLFVFGEVQYDV